MTGYSGTPLPKKLGIKVGHVVAVRGAPETFRGTLGVLPDDVTLRSRVNVPRNASTGGIDVIVAFFKRRAEFERRLPSLMEAVDVDGGLWIAWPKGSAGVPTDITEDVVRDVGVARGMVDNKVCAIDETWSGLRLVYRREDRAAVRRARVEATAEA
jgi:ABC-type Na+ transport system ATPase subunit NatA